MECPCCGVELSHTDSYYTGNYSAYEKGYENSGYQVLGDIYKCLNEKCEAFDEVYHTRGDDGDLYDGHPC